MSQGGLINDSFERGVVSSIAPEDQVAALQPRHHVHAIEALEQQSQVRHSGFLVPAQIDRSREGDMGLHRMSRSIRSRSGCSRRAASEHVPEAHGSFNACHLMGGSSSHRTAPHALKVPIIITHESLAARDGLLTEGRTNLAVTSRAAALPNPRRVAGMAAEGGPTRRLSRRSFDRLAAASPSLSSRVGMGRRRSRPYYPGSLKPDALTCWPL
jgi:hypothetical protein